jgi:hypothetical protein
VATGGRLQWDDRELDRLLNGRDGPVARDLQARGERGTQGAKRRCPVSPDGSHGRPSGYARSKIGWRLGRDDISLYVDVVSPALTPDGKPYGLFIEVGTDPHVIESHGPYPLRNRRTGQVFGRRVQHPGTEPQPYLRPALDDMR